MAHPRCQPRAASSPCPAPRFQGLAEPPKSPASQSLGRKLRHGVLSSLLAKVLIKPFLRKRDSVSPLRAQLTSRGLGRRADHGGLMALPPLGHKTHSGPGPCASPLGHQPGTEVFRAPRSHRSGGRGCSFNPTHMLPSSIQLLGPLSSPRS